MNSDSQLHKLSDDLLLLKTSEVARLEKETTLSLQLHLQEVSRRQLHLKRGYASLFSYVCEALGYSESQASERLGAMRLLSRVPEVKEVLESGALGLTQAAMTERHLRKEEKEQKSKASVESVRVLVEQVQGKTNRETEKILLSLEPPEALPEERVRPLQAEVSELRFCVNEETQKLMERFWELQGKGSLSDLLKTCLSFYLQEKDPVEKLKRGKLHPIPKSNKTEVTPPEKVTAQQEESQPREIQDPESDRDPYQEERSRYIPIGVKRTIRERAQEHCEYVDRKTGKRCESRYLLQYDHKTPYVWGGSTALHNLQLLCRAHNLFKKMQMPEKRSQVEFRPNGNTADLS